MRLTNFAVAAVLTTTLAAGVASVAAGQRADGATPTPVSAQTLPADNMMQMMQHDQMTESTPAR